jgi:hypothetical protein
VFGPTWLPSGDAGRRRVDRVAVEVAREACQPLFAAVVALGVAGCHVAHQQIDRIDAGHAMPLPHQPAARQARQRIGGEITDIGGYDVQRAAGMALGRFLEVLGHHLAPVGMDLVGVRHVHGQPHAGRRETIRGPQRAVDARRVACLAASDQHLREVVHAQLSLVVVHDGSEPARPAPDVGIGLVEEPHALGDPG